MKEGQQGSHLEFRQDADEYKRIAENQRIWFRKLADKIRGDDQPLVLVPLAKFHKLSGKNKDDPPLTLEPLEREAVAGILRMFAAQIPDAPKGKQGPPPKFDPASEAVIYAMGRLSGRRHSEMIAAIADRIEESSGEKISEVAVANGIKKWRAQAFKLLGKPDPGNK